jgi:hypothetical protein
MFLLFALSARTPPNGDKRIVGNIARAKKPANIVAEPVTSKTYIDNAKSNIQFPNKDTACPVISNEKFLENNLPLIIPPSISNLFDVNLINE